MGVLGNGGGFLYKLSPLLFKERVRERFLSVIMKKVNVEMVSPPSGKGWWPKVKNVVKKVGAVAAIVAASPLKLPKVVMGVAQYLALLAGLVDASKTEKDE